MNSVFWFTMGIMIGYLLFQEPELIANAGNWLVEQSKELQIDR